jgi:hypothetical protein
MLALEEAAMAGFSSSELTNTSRRKTINQHHSNIRGELGVQNRKEMALK